MKTENTTYILNKYPDTRLRNWDKLGDAVPKQVDDGVKQENQVEKENVKSFSKDSFLDKRRSLLEQEILNEISSVKRYETESSYLQEMEGENKKDASDLIESINGSFKEVAVESNYLISELSRINRIASENSEIDVPTRTKRDRALRELAEIMDINYVEKGNGSVVVYSEGTIIVDNFDFSMIKEKKDNDKIKMYWEYTDKEVEANSGKIKALNELRDRIIPEIINEMKIKDIENSDSTDSFKRSKIEANELLYASKEYLNGLDNRKNSENKDEVEEIYTLYKVYGDQADNNSKIDEILNSPWI